MRKICSLCNIELACKDDGHPGIMHGICKSCAKKTQKRELHSAVYYLINKMKEPALIIENVDIITMANKLAKNLLGDGLEGELPGDAFACACATFLGGCGKTSYCDKCALREALAEVLKTGVTVKRKVMQDFMCHDGTCRRIITFSMEKAGSVILLIIKNIENVNILPGDLNKNLCWQIVDE